MSSLPNDVIREFYEQRASGGLLITEATAVSEEASGWRNAPQLTTQRHADAWKKVVDAVHAKGGLIYVQLWHMGRQAHSSFHPSTHRTVSASAIPIPDGKVRTINQGEVDAEVPHALTVNEIQQVFQDFVNAARLAKDAGFDGIELHGANGYLIDQFLQSTSNQRTDQYGGNAENRARFLTDLIDAIITSGSYPADRIGVRISPNGTYGGMGSDDNFEMFFHTAARLNSYGLAYLHVMDGVGFGFHGKDRAVTLSDIRKGFDGPILANVGLTKEMAEGLLRSGAADGAVFGRLYMSNPDLVERFAKNWPLEEPAPYDT